MLRARLSNGDFLFGLDAENVKRLTEGQPIVIDLASMGGQNRVLIMYGKTLDAIKMELAQATGHRLPPVQPYYGDDNEH